ncbi:2-phosphosulfolactate phosphatase family protein [Clostridium chrysemydis]|uniref:2-phosphosulfolactate phosphatase family protein n=1 Tax=Clostridium chrysemydis TaxID=2665504 RepID=UPI00188437F2|nr:2-phosphosulfolactate phosphatase family protein [Clostridium chrysemydis]
MKLDVIVSPEHINKEYIKDKVVVVIDMLRATTVMTTAFMNGCKEVIPCLTVEDALEEASKLKREEYILGGERKALKIEGFDLSNSPLEYTEEIVKGKTVIMSTTNGTRTLTDCKDAKRVFVASMLNGQAVAKKLVEINEDAIIVNAGTNGNFTMDDFICGGYIIDEMLKLTGKIELTDIAKTSKYIYENNKDIISFISGARHYGVMKELNLLEDVSYAIKKSVTNIVPEYKEGHIIN